MPTTAASVSPDPSKPLSPPFFWGIDIGGTSIKCGLVDHFGKTIAYDQLPTREPEGPQAAVDRVADYIQKTETSLGIVGQVPAIGLGAPGPMDLPRGMLIAPPQLPSWWEFSLCKEITKATGRPVSFLNDANAAAYGEFWLGSALEESSMILLTLGTGVGGGIIVENELVNGVNSFGSECGHILIDSSPDAKPCGWGGGHGELEAYASATGVVLRTLEQLPANPDSTLAEFATGHPVEPLTAKHVHSAAVAGDAFALNIVDQTARWLGIGMTTLVHTLDPGSVVLGGAMDFGGADCPVGQRFLKGISMEFKRRTFPSVFAGTHLSFATLGADAGYLGAAGYAQKQNQ